MADDPGWTPKQDMSLLCRVCANQHDYLIPIFEGEGLDHDMPTKMDKHLPIKVRENDKLPTQMCYQCASTIIAWSELVTNCLEADKKLSRMLKINEKKSVTAAIADEDEHSDHYEDTYDDVGGGDDDDTAAAPDDEDFEKEIKQLISDAGVELVSKSTKSKTIRTSTRKRKSETVTVKKESKKSKTDSSVNKSSTSLSLIKPKEEVTSSDDRWSLWSCCICSGKFGSPADLGLHLRLHNNSLSFTLTDNDECFKCKNSIACHNVKIGMGTKSKGTFLCWYCNYGLEDKRQLEIHIKIEHGHIVYGQNEWYGCRICFNMLYSRRQDIIRHMLHIHNETIIRPEEYLVNSIQDINLPCEVCGVKNLFAKYCKAHNSYTDETSSFDCKFCEDIFADKRILQAHVNIEHGREVHDDVNFQCFMCKICCDQLYLGCDQFQAHLRDVHGESHIVFDSYAVTSLEQILLSCKLCSEPCVFSGFCREHDANVSIDNCSEHPERHSCESCNVLYNDCNDLWIHLFSQHIDETLYCNLCEKSSDSIIRAPNMLMKHWRRVHKSSGVDLLTEEELRERSAIEIDGEIKFECPECNTLMKNFGYLKKHVRDAHSGETFSCDECSKSFSTKKSLRDHYKKLHTIRIRSSREENDMKKKTMIYIEGVVKYKCPECGFMVKRFQGLREHIVSVHAQVKEHICIVCGSAFGLARRLKTHYIRRHTVNILTQANHDNEDKLDVTKIFNVNKEDCQIMQGEKIKFKCPECPRSYGNFSELKKHLAVHTGEKHFVCSVCQRGFYMKNRLNEHYKRVHHMNFTSRDHDLRRETETNVDGVRKYKCPHSDCPSSFQRFNALQEHMLSHTGEKPYTCETCGKSFPLKRRLNAHYNKWHLGKGYRCHICGSTMSNAANFKDHLDSHRGEKKYTCETCGTGFAYKSSLYHHRFTHIKDRTYPCTYCERKYQSPKTLKEHLKVHTNGDVRHICQTCGGEFHTRKNLLTHMRTHNTDRIHVCEFCNANLKTRRSLLRHYTTHGTQLAAIAFNNIPPAGPPVPTPSHAIHSMNPNPSMY